MTITATIVPRPDSTYPVVLNPYKVDLSQLGEKVIDQSPIAIKNVSDQLLEISLVATEGGLFEVDLPKSVGPGEEVTGKVTLIEAAHTQSFQKSFTLELTPPGGDAASASRFTVPVKRTLRVSNQAGATKVLPRGGE